MEYILFIQSNNHSQISEQEWSEFFIGARQSGIFLGGSEIGPPRQYGAAINTPITRDIGGFMRFEADVLRRLEALIKKHPVVLHGGSVELCEMPRS